MPTAVAMQSPAPPAVRIPPMQAPPAPVSAPGKNANWWPLIIGANVLFVLVVILILIFALKK
jgi:hypothetical protein